MKWATRNLDPLTEQQVEYCRLAWNVLRDSTGILIELDVSRAQTFGTTTGFSEASNVVFLGANAYPGYGVDANSRLSPLACLAHEITHARRFARGYRRPTELPHSLLDEAETSIDASFVEVLSPKDQEDLVEDARDRLIQWLAR